MRAYQMTGRGGGVRESTVIWSGKNEFLSGKSQGISFQTKSGHPERYACILAIEYIIFVIGKSVQYRLNLTHDKT